MRSETQRKGELAKCKVLFRAYEKGMLVSEPTIDADYDLIIDDNDHLFRCQVKYADSSPSNSSGCVKLGLRRTTRNGKILLYDPKHIDAILVYLHKVDKIVWLPAEKWIGKNV